MYYKLSKIEGITSASPSSQANFKNLYMGQGTNQQKIKFPILGISGIPDMV